VTDWILKRRFDLLEKIKRDFTPLTWVLIPSAVLVNGAGGWIMAKLDIPFYLDTIGTIFVAVVAGPFAGALAGVLTNVILGYFSAGYAPYWPVPLLIGLVAGFCANAGMFKSWWKVLLAGLLIAMTAAVASATISARVFGGFTFDPAYFLLEEPLDKIVTALIVFVIAQFLPEAILSRLPRPENVKPEEK
jgi:energy-coupling factor transport system substrate-specific component